MMSSPIGTLPPLHPVQHGQSRPAHFDSNNWESDPDLFPPRDDVHDENRTPTRAARSSEDRRRRYHHRGRNESSHDSSFDAPLHYEEEEDDYGHAINPSSSAHHRHGSRHSASPSYHDIHRGAGIVRQGIEGRRSSSGNSETRNILRGAEIIRSQIMSQYGSNNNHKNHNNNNNGSEGSSLCGTMSRLTFSSSAPSLPIREEDFVMHPSSHHRHHRAPERMQDPQPRNSKHMSKSPPVINDNIASSKQQQQQQQRKSTSPQKEKNEHDYYHRQRLHTHLTSPPKLVQDTETTAMTPSPSLSPRKQRVALDTAHTNNSHWQTSRHRSHHHHPSSPSVASSNSSYSSSSSPVSVDAFTKQSNNHNNNSHNQIFHSKQDRAAYLHAQKAGQLWLTLVGAHLRFPSHWFNGARSPRMGNPPSIDHLEPSCWKYGATELHLAVASARVSRGSLDRYVQNRRSAGRVLLHIIVRDEVTLCPIRDVAVGCYHPNARGVRKTEKPHPDAEDFRSLWIAVRKRRGGGGEGGFFVDSLLTMVGDSGEQKTHGSPLGKKHFVNNDNVRAVFGDAAPVETLFLVENHLRKLMYREGNFSLPAMRLVAEFLF